MPALLELTVKAGRPLLRGQAHYWSVIRDVGRDNAEFTVGDIDAHCGGTVSASTVRGYLRQLAAGGYVEVIDAGNRRTPGRYRLLRRPVEPPRLGADGDRLPAVSRQQAMWNALRAAESIDARELAVTASTEQATVELWTAKSYLKHLAEAGYLQVVRAGRQRHLTVYRLSPRQNSGPLAPKVLRTKLVYDPNRHEVMGRVLAEEDTP